MSYVTRGQMCDHAAHTGRSRGSRGETVVKGFSTVGGTGEEGDTREEIIISTMLFETEERDSSLTQCCSLLVVSHENHAGSETFIR